MVRPEYRVSYRDFVGRTFNTRIMCNNQGCESTCNMGSWAGPSVGYRAKPLVSGLCP